MNQLTIKNLGPVKEATVELKPFLVLIGGQGTGKSTIVKVLTICLDILFYLRVLKEDDPHVLFREFGIDEYFKEDSYISFRFGDVSLEYKDGQFRWTSTALSDTDEAFKIFMHLLNSNTKKILKSYIGESEITSDVMQKYGRFIRSNSRMALYIPAERNLIGNLSPALASVLTAGVPLQKTLLEYMSLFEKAKQEFQIYPVEFLHLTFKKGGQDEGVEVDGEAHSQPIPLNHCSSGIQSVLPLLMVVDYAMKLKCFNHFVLEEPEQNLFPKNQTELLRFLISKTHATGFSAEGLMITTHSPYLLSALNISLLAGKLAKEEALTTEVEAILPRKYHVDPEQVAAYALGDEDVYCRSIINEKTGTIDQNYLDTASDVLGDEFNRLYRLYIKSIRK